MLHSVLLHSTLCVITYRLPRQRMLDSGNLDWEVRLNSMKENAVLVVCRRIYRKKVVKGTTKASSHWPVAGFVSNG